MSRAAVRLSDQCTPLSTIPGPRGRRSSSSISPPPSAFPLSHQYIAARAYSNILPSCLPFSRESSRNRDPPAGLERERRRPGLFHLQRTIPQAPVPLALQLPPPPPESCTSAQSCTCHDTELKAARLVLDFSPASAGIPRCEKRRAIHSATPAKDCDAIHLAPPCRAILLCPVCSLQSFQNQSFVILHRNHEHF